MIACPECSTVGIQLTQSKSRHGLAIEYFLRCTNVGCSWEKHFFHPLNQNIVEVLTSTKELYMLCVVSVLAWLVLKHF